MQISASMSWEALGIEIPRILLPRPDADWASWAVLACDQYSSQPEYWQNVEALTAGKPSALSLVLPEVWLNDADCPARVTSAQAAMRTTLESGFLRELPPGGVLVERRMNGRVRKGLLLAIDLEQYAYAPDAQTPIRPTEGTIEDRIPPRLQVRENADLELPHTLVLIDDPDRTAIEPLFRRRDRLERLYDFDLMLGGGHVAGYYIPKMALEGVREALSSLYTASRERYGQPLLFAVGDGNHSLATALAHWKAVKQTLTEDEIARHPARHSLVEIVNIHDAGVAFEPIHRVLFGLSAPDKEALETRLARLSDEGTPSISAVQAVLDAFLIDTPTARLDYIHGAECARRIGGSTDRMCILFEPMEKAALFATIAASGPLPRKAFSMGEADEKRFYLEARRIR